MMRRHLFAACFILGIVWLAACSSNGGTGDPPSEPDIENPIVITRFGVTPDRATPASEVTFSWQIDSLNNESLTCTLDFGDDTEVAVIESCSSSSTQTHTYQEEGSYTANLMVSDGSSEPVSSTTTVSVGNVPDEPLTPDPGGECTLESNNNSQDTPCRLNIGKTYEGQLGTEEENDYYEFTTPENSAGIAEILLASIPAGQRLTFELLDANKNPIDTPFTNYTDNNPGEFFVLSPRNTTYYLRVSNGSFGNTSNETYNISVAYKPDDDELNEGIGQATPLTFTDGTTSEEDGLAYGFTYIDGKQKDVDIYEMNVALAEGQAGVISVVLPNAPIGLQSSILNEAEQPIEDGFGNERFTSEGNTLEYSIITESRTLYLTLTRTSSDKGSTRPYRLNTSLDTKDTFEPNNSDVDPPDISPGETVEGYINGQFIDNGEFRDDLDYFAIALQPNQDIEVELSSVPASQTLTLRVLDSNGAPISGARDIATSTNPGSITISNNENPSFIEISGNSFSANDSYTLSVRGLQ